MRITISNTPLDLGNEVSRLASLKLREAISLKGEARLLMSTGASQFDTLAALLQEKINWEKTEIFHLDEYIGLPADHKANFRKYLNERFIGRIGCKKFYSIDTEKDALKLIADLTHEIRKNPVDVGLIGIGENAHIAFNDPPADFDTRESFKIVELDKRCRMQQVGEGWFNELNEVPLKAITMTVWQIMQCKTVISAVPYRAKAEAIAKTLRNPLTRMVPATVLKQHADFNLFLDKDSASEIISL